ncbi:hypothetical protein O6H91_03G117800 [Diphasiastrum complanatum]|uniref:Uncharacterized protein n=1 Tax=Diphasiastrum complanatum TaxID=34168 RepID=A0ACC2EAT8_DIPCM|nr:hypothetical protein O6H91_03G117800 [Diphasiastrum complanatum]
MAAVARVIPSSASPLSSPQQSNASFASKHHHQQHLNIAIIPSLPVQRGLPLCNRSHLLCKVGKGNASVPLQMKPSAFSFNLVSCHGLDDGDAAATAARLGNAWGATAIESASASAPGVAQRSAEADVMGLLLKQRIVFLGHQMDDFVADAIVSQLLLLDANDPTKDIRLFINCPGGSMRYSSSDLSVEQKKNLNLCYFKCMTSHITTGIQDALQKLPNNPRF